MYFNIYINQKMAVDENISFDAALIFDIIKRLIEASFTTKYVDDRSYKIIHNSFILMQIPQMKISTRTLSRILKELKNADLIQWDGSTHSPGYAFTEKGNKYIKNKNDQEITTIPSDLTKKRKKFLFALKKKTRLENLPKEYFSELTKRALLTCDEKGIPRDEVNKFYEVNAAKGYVSANWFATFLIWCRRHKEYKMKDETPQGLYC